MDPYVKHIREDKIGIIEFGNSKGNSLPRNLLEEINYKLKILNDDSRVKVILLRSKLSKAFCGGASFLEMKLLKSEEEATKFFMGFANVLNAMRRCPQPIIGRMCKTFYLYISQLTTTTNRISKTTVVCCIYSPAITVCLINFCFFVVCRCRVLLHHTA